MLEEPIPRVEELEAPKIDEEDLIEDVKRRVLKWIEWRKTTMTHSKNILIQ